MATHAITKTQFEAINTAMKAGLLDDAAALAAAMLSSHPADPNSSLLAGIIAHRRGDPQTAIANLERACAMAPNAAAAWFWLARAYQATGNLPAVITAFQRTVAIAPRFPAAAYELGVALETAGDPSRAGPNFLLAATTSTTPSASKLDAIQRAVNCAGRIAKLPRDTRPQPTNQHRSDSARTKISFIVPSRESDKLAAFTRSLSSTFDQGTWELIHVGDARSMNEAFTRGTARASGDLFVYCHDDIAFVEPDFQRRLINALASADVVGVCGTTQLVAPGLGFAGQAHQHGWVTHRNRNNDTYMPSICGTRTAPIDDAQALDGVFIATKPTVVAKLGFDTDRFDGWHLYDIDFSYRAYKAGLRVRVQPDLLITHASFGRFREDYEHYAQRFCAKHPEIAMPTAPSSAPFFETSVDTVEQVRDFYACVGGWLQALPRE